MKTGFKACSLPGGLTHRRPIHRAYFRGSAWFDSARRGFAFPQQPATCMMMCLKLMMHLSWSLSTMKESPLQSGSADSLTNPFHWLHDKSLSLFSHLKAFILKQHYRIRCFSGSSNWTRLLKRLKVNAMKRFENTKRARETKEIQSEAMKVLRAEHRLLKTSFSQVSCSDLSWASVWGVDGCLSRVGSLVRRHSSPLNGSRGSILTSLTIRMLWPIRAKLNDLGLFPYRIRLYIFVCACVSMWEKHQNFSAHSPAAAEKVGHPYYLRRAAFVTVIKSSSVCESVSVVKDALALVWSVCVFVCVCVCLQGSYACVHILYACTIHRSCRGCC